MSKFLVEPVPALCCCLLGFVANLAYCTSSIGSILATPSSAIKSSTIDIKTSIVESSSYQIPVSIIVAPISITFFTLIPPISPTVIVQIVPISTSTLSIIESSTSIVESSSINIVKVAFSLSIFFIKRIL